MIVVLKRSLLALSMPMMWLGGHVNAKMTQSPLQVTMSRDTLHDIINSAGVEILQVFDNILLDDLQLEGYSITGIRLASGEQSQETKEKFEVIQ